MRRLRIMLAEDHKGMADQLQALLAEDYDVELVNDGTSLLARLRLASPDALVTDISMPGVSGLAAARTARDLYPSLPIVFVTVADSPDVIKRALLLDPVGYVLKCDAGEELLSALRVVRSGKTFLSAHAAAALRKV